VVDLAFVHGPPVTAAHVRTLVVTTRSEEKGYTYNNIQSGVQPVYS
jgi:hypothetical protein